MSVKVYFVNGEQIVFTSPVSIYPWPDNSAFIAGENNTGTKTLLIPVEQCLAIEIQ